MHLVADPRAAGSRQGPLDREARGRVRRVRHRLLRLGRSRARLDAIRAGGCVPASHRAAGRARRATTRSSSRARTWSRRRAPGCCSRSSSRRSARHATAARAGSRRSPTATPRASPRYERFRVHKTVFPQDFLADFGFEVVRTSGRISLSRLELGGLVPVEEGAREKVLRVVRDAFGVPEPVPSPPPY